MDFKSLSRQYKGSLLLEIGLFCLSVLVSALLLFKLVIPQFQTWTTMNEEIKVTRQHIATIKDNIAYLESLQDSEVEDALTTANAALPIRPDFTGAMQSILSSSVNSGVQLSEFTFTVGTIATSEAGMKSTPPPMDINIIVTGDGKGLKDFVTSLYEYLPLSTITTASSSVSDETQTKISIAFPSKPLPDVSFLRTEPIPKNTADNQQTLSTLKEWQAKQLVLTDDNASTSDSLPPPF